MAQAGRSRAAIGAHEAAAPQQDAAEPACHHDSDRVERLSVDGLQDRLSRSAGWFAVVAEAIDLPDAPSPAIMGGGGVRLRFDEASGRVFVRHGTGGSDETAFLDVLRKGFGAIEREHEPSIAHVLRRANRYKASGKNCVENDVMRGKQISIIGGGPAGLMAAEVLSSAGADVTLYEAMPTVARKFLMAGKSGLNITHAEPYSEFVTRFGSAQHRLRSALDEFTPDMLRHWTLSLGQETFTGTSGRVFPISMKASPLLRAWLARLEGQGVHIKTRHRWTGFKSDALCFETPWGETLVEANAVLLALGGASWPKLGSNAAWVSLLRQRSITINEFRPANCGFDVNWSDYFRERFSGVPVKSVAITSSAGRHEGEFVITRHGVEGSVVYAHTAALRDAFGDAHKPAMVVDLMPGRSRQRLAQDLERHPRKDSLSNRLRKAAGLSSVKVGLLRECHPDLPSLDASDMAAMIKAAPVQLSAVRPIAEAISSAGGIDWDEIDSHWMLKHAPGIFVAGEMVDWEAPTGGYLLTACFAMGKAAAKGMIATLGDVG